MGCDNKGRGEMAQFSQSKGKEIMSVKLLGEAPPKTKKSGSGNQEFKFPSKLYSFKDEQLVTIFHLLQKVVSWSYQRFDARMKWDVWTFPTIASFIGWCCWNLDFDDNNYDADSLEFNLKS